MKTKRKTRWMRWINMWPPFLGAGIKVVRMDEDMRAVDVEMKLTRLNRNYVGTHYGGSLYSMADPFYMLMLIANLGREYIVWDRRRPSASRSRARVQCGRSSGSRSSRSKTSGSG